MIIDSHAHVMLPVEKQFMLMKEAGIDKTLLFSTTPHPEKASDLEEFEKEIGVLNYVLSGECTQEERISNIKRTTGELCKIINEYPDRFLGFGAVPLFLPYKEICNWINDHVISNGLLGIGEIAISPGRTDLLDNIFRALMELKKMPVWIHTFHPLELNDIKDIAALAKEYPQIPVILGHMGGTNWLDSIKLAKEQKNIYLDLSAVFTTIAPSLAIRELPERTLFSSDAPYGSPLLSRKMVEILSPDPKVTEMVLGKNIETLLEIS